MDRPAERLDERGMRRQTLYLPPEVYEQIRQITIMERTSQQAFFREAIDWRLPHEDCSPGPSCRRRGRGRAKSKQQNGRH